MHQSLERPAALQRLTGPIATLHALFCPLLVASWIFLIRQVQQLGFNFALLRGFLSSVASGASLNLNLGELPLLIYLGAFLGLIYGYALRSMRRLERRGVILFVLLQLVVIGGALFETGVQRLSLAGLGTISLILGLVLLSASSNKPKSEVLERARHAREGRIKHDVDSMLGR